VQANISLGHGEAKFVAKEPAAEDTRELLLLIVVDDPFDGAMRVLGDAQRFGFGLQQFRLEAEGGRRISIRLTLIVPRNADADLIRARFARHSTILSLESA
jgi:hypothetical protein